MSTSAQIAANQANAQKSTGPVTSEGKLTSSQNRRIHGLGGKFQVLPCESQEEFEALLTQLDADYEPSVASEYLLVERMAQSQWLADRALRLQQTALDPVTGEVTDEKKFYLYNRYFTTHNNAYRNAMNDLVKQRKTRIQTHIGSEREKRNREAHPFRISILDLEVGQRSIEQNRPRTEATKLREAYADHIWKERVEIAR